MNCNKYLELTPFEKAKYMASLIHVCQSNDDLFNEGLEMIKAGEEIGLFNGITILPDLNKVTNETN